MTADYLFFQYAHHSPPTLVLGLNQLDLSSNVNIQARIELATWSTTTHFSSSCTWLGMSAGEGDLQCGRHHT